MQAEELSRQSVPAQLVPAWIFLKRPGLEKETPQRKAANRTHRLQARPLACQYSLLAQGLSGSVVGFGTQRDRHRL
jgi:hypothetical protein